MKTPKFVFDLDGTLTRVETLPIIAREFGVEGSIRQLTRQTVEGNIPFMESFIQRVHILGDVPVKAVSNTLRDVPLYEKIVNFIEEHSEDCAIATGNVNQWVDQLLGRIKCRAYCSQAIIKNGRIHKLSRILKKEDIVKDLQKQGCEVVFIGDGHNDQEAMRCADVAIATGFSHFPARSLLPVSDYMVFDENSLCRLLNRLS